MENGCILQKNKFRERLSNAQFPRQREISDQAALLLAALNMRVGKSIWLRLRRKFSPRRLHCRNRKCFCFGTWQVRLGRKFKPRVILILRQMMWHLPMTADFFPVKTAIAVSEVINRRAS